MATVEADGAVQQDQVAHLNEIDRFLADVSFRLRLLLATRYISNALIAASLLLVCSRLLAYIYPRSVLAAAFSWSFTLLIFLVPAVVAAASAFSRRHDVLSIARLADERLGLKDRLSTAVSLRWSRFDSTFTSYIIADAARAARSSTAGQTVLLKWSSRQTIAVACLIVTSALNLLPQSPLSVFSSRYRSVFQQSSIEAPPSASLTPPPYRPKQLSPGQSSAQKAAVLARKPTEQQSRAQLSSSGTNHGAGKANPVSNGGHTGSSSDKQRQQLAEASSIVESATSRLKPQTTGHSGGKSPPGGSGEPSSNSTPGQTPPGKQATKSDQSTVPTLGDKLRQFADRLSIRRLTTGEEQQASSSLESVNRKLDGLQMPKTQQKLSSAEQELNSDRQQAAIDDIRAAANYADHEGAAAPPGGQNGQGGTAKDAFSVPSKSSTSSGAGQQSSSAGGGQQSSGAGSSPQQSSEQQSHSSGTGVGAGGSGTAAQSNPGGPGGKGQSGLGYGGGTQKPNFGTARQIDPSKLGKLEPIRPVSLPINQPNGRSAEMSGGSAASASPGKSVVPYTEVQTDYSKSAGQAVSAPGENIPPAYKDLVRRYFSSGSATK